MSAMWIGFSDSSCGAGAAGGAKDYPSREHQMTNDTPELEDAVLMEFLHEAMEIIRLNATARHGFKIRLEPYSGGSFGSDSPSGVYISASFNGFIMNCRWHYRLGGDCKFKIDWWINMQRGAKENRVGYQSKEFPIEDPRTATYLEKLTKRLACVDWDRFAENLSSGMNEEDTR